MLNCNFCGKSQHKVSKLIAGPDVCICNHCIWLCLQILIDDKTVLKFQDKAVPDDSTLP